MMKTRKVDAANIVRVPIRAAGFYHPQHGFIGFDEFKWRHGVSGWSLVVHGEYWPGIAGHLPQRVMYSPVVDRLGKMVIIELETIDA